MKFKYSFYFLCIFMLTSTLYGADLSGNFKKVYESETSLDSEEQAYLEKFDFYLVPGILSEAFIEQDERSTLDFSRLTGEYFNPQLKLLQEKYAFSAERLSSSSRSVSEIQFNIRMAINQSLKANKKAIFITHSLGGLALLEELISNEKMQDTVSGVIFLQSPFYGTPIADVYLNDVFYTSKWLKPALPFFNTTEDTLLFLSTDYRSKFMNNHKAELVKLTNKISMITVNGIANGHSSLFRPAVNIIENGCLQQVQHKCIGKKLFKGQMDLSDGMVPDKSSLIANTDFVRLEGVDHGELVVNIPFTDYNKKKVTEGLLKLLYKKLSLKR